MQGDNSFIQSINNDNKHDLTLECIARIHTDFLKIRDT